MPQGSRILAAIPVRQELCNGSIPGRNQLNDMNVPIRCKPTGDAGQHLVYIRVVDVVQETVDEYKVELPGSLIIVGGYIGDDKSSLVFSLGALDLVRINVNAEVVCIAEEIGIRSGSASHI
jgi:hypothetical protein